MILKVYTKNVIYSSEELADYKQKRSVEKTILYNCTFNQTNYGSVIITTPTKYKILELYPNSIDSIIHLNHK